MPQEGSKYKTPLKKKGLSILVGDEKFGTMEVDGMADGIELSMPYLSGPKICDISNQFGLPVIYGENDLRKSRWEYLEDLVVYCIRQKRESELFAYLFSEKRFEEKLQGQSAEVIKKAYSKIVDTAIKQINGVMYFSGYKLMKVGQGFVIHKCGKPLSVEMPAIKRVDRSYIIDLSKRAAEEINNEHYDSAVSQSRTLLEEVFCYVIEMKGEKPSEKGDIGKLYGQVKQLYHMHSDKEMDKRINELLSGLEKILKAITEMRNKASDAHGVGAKRINLEEHHARLCVNSAITMAEFILSVSEHAREKEALAVRSRGHFMKNE